jgi:hypothetical protein
MGMKGKVRIGLGLACILFVLMVTVAGLEADKVEAHERNVTIALWVLLFGVPGVLLLRSGIRAFRWSKSHSESPEVMAMKMQMSTMESEIERRRSEAKRLGLPEKIANIVSSLGEVRDPETGARFQGDILGVSVSLGEEVVFKATRQDYEGSEKEELIPRQGGGYEVRRYTSGFESSWSVGRYFHGAWEGAVDRLLQEAERKQREWTAKEMERRILEAKKFLGDS